MELSIVFQSPDLLRFLIIATNGLHSASLHDVSNILVGHANNVAITYLGASHPVSQICDLLQKIDRTRDEVRARLSQCQVDHFEEELGLWHWSTKETRYDLLMVLKTSEAVDRARASLAEYECSGSTYDDIWCKVMDSLTRALVDDRQYESAERVREGFWMLLI